MRKFLACVLIVSCWSWQLAAAPAIGDPAPAFTLPGSDAKTHHLADYRGRYVVLAWFPKTFTKG